MPPSILYCRKCSVGYTRVGDIPRICPTCVQETTWTTAPENAIDAPKIPWELNVMDVRFLRSIRIDPELSGSRSGAMEKP
jgi:hypothetical protein